jgi:hypothetical protein
MAIVQVSRIQQRRGRKLAGTGFPQLASGEIGWAVDTQELYIGNGSVSEGAPYVGNTKILTEHDNLLDIVNLYQYKRGTPSIQTGDFPSSPVQRTLQERLDDVVSVASFGVLPNGFDVTVDLQRAIDQLFLNISTKTNISSRTVLYFEPGEYIISEEIKIPPFAHLIGAGIDSTIIRFQGSEDFGAFRLVDGDSTPGNYISFESMSNATRPRFIHIEGMTIKTDRLSPILFLDNTETSTFERVKFEGVYVNGVPVTNDAAAVYIRGASSVFRSENVHFNSCVFSNTGFGVFSVCDHAYIHFNDCKFYQLYDAINIGGDFDGAVGTTVTNCWFDLIDRYGYWVKLGYANISSNNQYINVGNDNQNYANAIYPIIRFDTDNNQSLNDYFERNKKLKDQNLYGFIAYRPSIQTNSLIIDNYSYRTAVGETLVGVDELLRFPVVTSSTYKIDYVINKDTYGSAVRTGTLHITANIGETNCAVIDNFNYTGSNSVENINFSATLEDLDFDSVSDTLVVKVFNPIVNSIFGTITSNLPTTTITGVSSTANLYPGMALTRTVIGVGDFGDNAVIVSIDSINQITITADTANTAGALQFRANNGTGTINYTYMSLAQ